jgi:hypothetical protein
VKKNILVLVAISLLTIGCGVSIMADMFSHKQEPYYGTQTFGDVVDKHYSAGKQYMLVRFDFIVPIGYSLNSREVDFYRIFECENETYPCNKFRVGNRVYVSNFDGKRHKNPIGDEIKRLSKVNQADIFLEHHSY